MTTTQLSGLAALEALKVPVKDGHIQWDALSSEEVHQVVRNLFEHLDTNEPNEPTDGILERSIQLEETIRAITPLQHRYAGLLEDAYSTPKLRATVGLSQGKTPFRDANDFIAKTHGLRAFEATGRLKLSRHLTPARASDPSRDSDIDIGTTRYPLLGALQAQGKLHPSKLSTAVNMLTSLDEHAVTAGKDRAFRNQLQEVVESDLADKIEHTTPEEFSRYVSRRKADLIAAMDPPAQQFTTAQTEAMHNLRHVGPVRGNPGANKWELVADAELNELLSTLASFANNPRTNSDFTEPTDSEEESADDALPDKRTRGQRTMHALRDALKFSVANLQHTDLPGTNGNHTELVVLTDYPTLIQHLRDEVKHLLPDVEASRREYLIEVLSQMQLEAQGETPFLPNDGSEADAPSRQGGSDDGKNASENESSGDASADRALAAVLDFPTGATNDLEDVSPSTGPAGVSEPESRPTKPEEAGVVRFPPPKTTNLSEIFGDQNLDRLQPRIGQGIYTDYYPPEIILRLLCDVSVSPVTLTGDRQVLSVGRKQRQFRTHIRRAILARDRGCTVPGCHWPAAWCEMHHINFWSNDGETSIDNGITLCSHHHQALHAKTLEIRIIDGVVKFIQHRLIDPSQQPRQNYFWQN
jgi:hypothetical protein